MTDHPLSSFIFLQGHQHLWHYCRDAQRRYQCTYVDIAATISKVFSMLGFLEEIFKTSDENVIKFSILVLLRSLLAGPMTGWAPAMCTCA
jgi:hypothetical protein